MYINEDGIIDYDLDDDGVWGDVDLDEDGEIDEVIEWIDPNEREVMGIIEDQVRSNVL